MALPDYSYVVSGVAIIWAASGGSKTMNVAGLANNAGWGGDKSNSIVDGTYGFPEYLDIRVESNVGSTVAHGNVIDYYISESDSSTAGTANPGGVSGVNGTVVNATGVSAQMFYAGSLVLTSVLGTGVQIQRLPQYFPGTTYITPVVVNRSTASLGADPSPHKFVVTPWYRILAE